MPIKYVKIITREMVQSEPAARFVFGDNFHRVGMGGQAGSMRGEPNAIGICTKIKPSMSGDSFFSDIGAYAPDFRIIVTQDISRVWSALDQERTVYVPYDGLGTGLSELPKRAPQLLAMIKAEFTAMPGEPCPW